MTSRSGIGRGRPFPSRGRGTGERVVYVDRVKQLQIEFRERQPEGGSSGQFEKFAASKFGHGLTPFRQGSNRGQ